MKSEPAPDTFRFVVFDLLRALFGSTGFPVLPRWRGPFILSEPRLGFGRRTNTASVLVETEDEKGKASIRAPDWKYDPNS